MAKEYFRVSSGLKSLIGRELITDDFIAVFELVKNSFDAGATRVDIIFTDLDGDEPAIEIKDNGKGMSKSDLLNKWLFVAYSAKKEGTEDYRSNIRVPRIYAGAKGIGRFSCDRLGASLELLSRQKATGTCNRLTVDWDLFEEDSQEEFVEIPVSLTRRKCDRSGFKRGTILVIKDLREEWGRDKLLKLKRSLTKLINPNQSNAARKFAIHLHADEQKREDKVVPAKESWNRVNGPIQNFLFEELKIKATSIHVSIPESGGNVVSRLEDRGKFIYEIEEENSFGLKGIDIFLFSLNRSAKVTFARRMGMPSVQFGSVFLFKNGFRIYPFGEPGADPWGIDRRKQQGQSRFFGTRDLLGRIEIAGENPSLKEVTSRDGGLLKNAASDDLRNLFIEFALKRLERYAIGIIKWGNQDLELSGEFKSKIFELIISLTRSKSIVSFDYDPNILDILREASSKSLNSLVTQFSRLADETDNPKLQKDIRRAQRRIKTLELARREAEAEVEQAEEEREKAEAEAEEERQRAEEATEQAEQAEKKTEELRSQNLFLQSVVSSDVSNLVGLHHHIGIAAGTIQNYVTTMASRIRSGKPVSTEMFLSVLGKISMQASQISSSTKFATKANFAMDAAILKADIVEFIREYVTNVCQGVYFSKNRKPIEFQWLGKDGVSSLQEFRPFEVTVVLDNLISNSRKAGATEVTFEAKEMQGTKFVLEIADNGKGVSESNAEKLFNLGFTTTSGSGFGLYHVEQILDQMNARISFDETYRAGAKFVIEFRR